MREVVAAQPVQEDRRESGVAAHAVGGEDGREGGRHAAQTAQRQGVDGAHYLASRLTNKEIASENFRSTNTLKTYGKRIYRTLGGSSRSEAVTDARRLGFLYSPSGPRDELPVQRDTVAAPRRR